MPVGPRSMRCCMSSTLFSLLLRPPLQARSHLLGGRSSFWPACRVLQESGHVPLRLLRFNRVPKFYNCRSYLFLGDQVSARVRVVRARRAACTVHPKSCIPDWLYGVPFFSFWRGSDALTSCKASMTSPCLHPRSSPRLWKRMEGTKKTLRPVPQLRGCFSTDVGGFFPHCLVPLCRPECSSCVCFFTPCQISRLNIQALLF